jgi:hypothetical protein
LPWSLRPGGARGTQKARSMADVRAARTGEKIGYSGRDDNVRIRTTKEHSPFGFAQGKQESSRKRRGMGRRWLCHKSCELAFC